MCVDILAYLCIILFFGCIVFRTLTDASEQAKLENQNKQLREALQALYDCVARGDEQAPIRSNGAVRWSQAWDKVYKAMETEG